MRNVNTKKLKKRNKGLNSFILTMRNVNMFDKMKAGLENLVLY